MSYQFSVSCGLCALLVGGRLVVSVAAQAEGYSRLIQSSWDSIKQNVTESAVQMPEADYAFRPTADVRTFGQILGHLANEHYAICSAVKGEKDPNAEDFEKRTAKAELVKALNDSTKYCDAAYAGMTDTRGLEKIKIFDQEYSRAGGLQVNVTHDSEHYGNLVTYLRMKNQVPPTSRRSSP